MKSRSLDERMMGALYEAAMGFRVRSARYRALAEVSAQVASRDLARLVREGLLVASGDKRGRTYSASPFLITLRDRTREPRKSAADLYGKQLKLPL